MLRKLEVFLGGVSRDCISGVYLGGAARGYGHCHRRHKIQLKLALPGQIQPHGTFRGFFSTFVSEDVSEDVGEDASEDVSEPMCLYEREKCATYVSIIGGAT